MNVSFLLPPPPPPPPSGGGPDSGSGPATPPITALQSNLALFGYPLLFLLGLFGHTSSFLIFLRPTLSRISTSYLFIALTISDSIYLLVSIYDFLNVGLQQRDASISASAMCRLRSFVQWTAMCVNAWLLVAISTDRWIRVRFPFKSKQVCIPRNALYAAIIILILFAGFNVHTLSADLYGQLPAGVMTVCGPIDRNVAYNLFLRQIWPYLFSCIQTVIPVILLFIFSIDIFRRLTRQAAIQNRVQARRRTQLDNQMLLIMLASIALFVATTLPLGLFNILLSPILRFISNQTKLMELQSVLTFVAAINYTLNFYIHCFTSRLFRHELMQVIQFRRNRGRVGVGTETIIRVKPAAITTTQVHKN